MALLVACRQRRGHREAVNLFDGTWTRSLFRFDVLGDVEEGLEFSWRSLHALETSKSST